MRPTAILPLLLLSFAPLSPAQEPPEKIRVATKPIAPFVIEEGGRFVGFSIDLWDAIAQRMGVEYELVGKTTVSELLDALRGREVEVAIAGITITAEREKTVDFSHSIFESGLQILVSTRERSSHLDVLAALAPAILRAVGIVVLFLILAANLLWFFERKRNPGMFPPSYAKGLWEAFWWAGVTVTTVGYGDKAPIGAPGRVVALVAMFSGLVLVSYFTATVTTVMTVQAIEGTIQGPGDLAGKRVGTAKGTTAEAYLRERGVGSVGFETIESACTSLEEGELDAVVYDYPALVYYSNREGLGRTRLVGPVFARQNYGIGLQQGNEKDLEERINQALLDLRDGGEYDRLREKWFGPGE